MFVGNSVASGKRGYFCAVNTSFNVHDASCRIMSELSLKAQFVNQFWEASLNPATEAPKSGFCYLVLEQAKKLNTRVCSEIAFIGISLIGTPL